MKEQHGLPVGGQQPLHHFSNYDLIRRIDVGGMGEVYLAHQRTAFNRKVAVKIIRSDLVHDTTARKRFLREAEVSAHLKHDHILPLVEFGEEQGRLFIVTPYIEGGTLSRRLQSGPLSLAETHQLFTALVQAIAYIHKRGVIHRDLKPSNILLDKADDSDQVYVRLIDFGIASLQGKSTNPQMTIGGQDMGTIAYLAPERLDGIAATSNDIYSLGVILYQLLTGELPSVTNPIALPPALDTLIRRSTALHPADRYATADELLKAFEGTYRYLSSTRSVNLPLMALSTPAPVEIDDIPTPGRIVQTPRPQDPNPQVSPGPNTSNQSNRRSEARELNTTAQNGSQAAHTSSQSAPVRKVTAVQQAAPSTPSRRTSAEMPALPPRQPTASRPPGPRNPDEELDVLPLNSRSPKRAMLVHTQDQAGFTAQDYEARTSALDPALFQKKKSAHLKSEAAIINDPTSNPVFKPASKTRRRSLLALLPVSFLIILLVVGGLGYLAFQASITASVSLTPQVHAFNQAFTLKAKLGLNKADGSQIPANVLSSKKTGSLQGTATGRTDCTLLGILGCKQAVSIFDAPRLAEQLRPSLQKQIAQDLQNQALSRGAQLVGTISYNDGTITPNPDVGTQSKTVTVTEEEVGNVEYFTKGDAQRSVAQLLQQQVSQKFGSQYHLLDQYTRLGEPAVQDIDATGTVTIAIAAAGIAGYLMPDSELAALQSHLKGMTIKNARAYVSTLVGVDPATVSVRLSSGDTIPTNTQQIRLNMQTPNVAALLPVSLPKVSPGIPFDPNN